MSESSLLRILHSSIQARCSAIAGSNSWPCHDGCGRCCRRLSGIPDFSRAEWKLIWESYSRLPVRVREDVLLRVRSMAAPPPYTCPFLDLASESCRIYDSRPVLCRTYGFYRDRDQGQYCHEMQVRADQRGMGRRRLGQCRVCGCTAQAIGREEGYESMVRPSRRLRLVLVLLGSIGRLAPQTAPIDFLNHNRPVLDAHNCYPYGGHWADRIDRALKTGYPVAIEQDLAWYVDPATGAGRIVVSHEPKTTGSEPTLRHYFFDRVKPLVEKALAENDRDRWPLIVLHFDFKSTDAPLLHAVWNLLGEYQDWITTSVKTSNPTELSPFEAKPILVITEDSDEQEAVFFHEVPVGGRLRLFGSAHTNIDPHLTRQQRTQYLAIATPGQLLSTPPTNYRRWWNNSWWEVEEGGQHQAGKWTATDDRRLRALVDHAHHLGYWIRFYTIDGFAKEEDQGWGNDYNFGSRDAALVRWQASVQAGVNFIATDQYEALAEVMKSR